MIEIRAIGGYNEVGKNCTAIKIDNEVVICDMGIHLESYIKYTQDEDIIKISASELMEVGAVPDLSQIEDWKAMVKAIIPTHAHLDHCAAIPFIASRFNAPVLCTALTSALLNSICTDEKIKMKNAIKVLAPNSVYHLSKDIVIEFVSITHSIPQTVMIAIHTKYGIIIYANDFKFDNSPIVGKKPNIPRLKELGKKGVLALIVDSTYAKEKSKTPSEAVARELLRDVLLGTESKNKAVVVTTFSSHLARLKSIIEIGKTMRRKVLFLGRSLAKYSFAGQDAGLVNFAKDVQIAGYSNQVKRRLKEVQKNRQKYLLVVTGHQGEPRSTLSKMVQNQTPFAFEQDDHVVFSCKVIPTSTNIANRNVLENDLHEYGVRIFRDVHVSGHACREDLRDLINMTKPKHVIPAHGEPSMTTALAELAEEMGYKQGQTVHHLFDSQRLRL